MPKYLDISEDEAEIDRLLDYWAAQIRRLGATAVAGVRKVKVDKTHWAIQLSIYVSKESKAYKDFEKRFRR